jgi:phosphoglycolate phosphatase-like HAD superfamily hydrolase
MKQHITGCIFDLDGTLADTAPDIAIALNHALSAVGLTRLSLGRNGWDDWKWDAGTGKNGFGSSQ